MRYDHAVIWIDHHEAHVKYLGQHNPQLAAKVIGVEAADHPIERHMLEHARRFFKTADRMLTQPGSHRT